MNTKKKGLTSKSVHQTCRRGEDLNLRPSGYEPDELPTAPLRDIKMVEGDGFEPSKAVPADLQSAPFGHSGTPPRKNPLITTAEDNCKLEPTMGLEPATC